MIRKLKILKNPSSVSSTNKTPYLTHPYKVLYPEQGITKLELAEYYQHIYQWILPYIINRPLTLLRCPQGYLKKCFFQKHLHGAKVDDVYAINIKEKNKIQPYIYIKNKKGLLALIQMGVLEIHPWGASIDDIEKPNVIVFDLDPAPDVLWVKVVQTARLIHGELKKLHIESFVRTTGGKGLHIVIPIKRLYRWNEVKAFSQAFVQYIVSLNPNLYIKVMTKSKRHGKIFIDYLRNQRGATAIASYSTRARSGASIAVPLSWKELSSRLRSNAFNIKNIEQRLDKLKEDPWKDFFKFPQKLVF